MPVLGIDLGGTKLALALFSADGEPGERETVHLAGRSGRDVGALIVEQARALAARGTHAEPLASPADRVNAIGIAVPGIYRADSGTVWAPNIPGWDDYPLRDELGAAFGPEVAVTIDSDRAAYILGETWRGSARGSRNAIFLAVGTGIGAGILVDGRVLRGHHDIAGAIGWMALARPYRAEYAGCGCFEHHASGPGIVACARAQLAGHPEYDGVLRDIGPEFLSTAEVFAAYDAGDRIATRVVGDAVAFWGMAAANLVSLFNPEIIVFGGGVFGPAVRFLDRIRDEAERWAQPIAMREVTFVPSSLGNDAGLHGAARLAMQGVGAPASAPVSSPAMAATPAPKVPA
jgi:glucokinase